MGKTYIVIAESVIKNKYVLTLDKGRAVSDFNTKYINVDNNKFAYSPTHNENIIVVDFNVGFINKKISFCN